MSRLRSLEALLGQAKEKEKSYDWLAAVDFYQKASRFALRKKDFWKAGEIGERIGYCFYRAAFQAETNEDFKKRMQLAVEAYDRAADRFENVEKGIRGDFCKALAMYVNYWIAPNYAEKRELLAECRGEWKKVAAANKEAGDRFGYGKACNELLACLLDRFEIEQDWSNRMEILTEGLDYGEKAIATFSKLADDYELTRALYLTSSHCFWAARYSELGLEQREELNQKCLTFAKRALELSKEVGDGHLIGMSNITATFSQYWLVGNLKLSLQYAKKILLQGTITKDHYLMGLGLSWLADITFWMMMQEEDTDIKREGYREVMKYAEEAASHLNLLSPYAFADETVWVQIESHTFLARDVETKIEEKRTLFERAIKIGRKAVKRVKRSGNPESTGVTLHALSKALFFLSQMETEPRYKKELLLEASKLREGDIEIAARAFPSWYWYRGVGRNYQALILAELSLIENDDRKKRNLLEKAVLNMEECLKLCAEWTRFYPQTMLFVVLGMYYDWFGKILSQLYQLTGETENLQKMIRVYQGALEAYNKADMPSRLAETYWQIAKVKDKLGEHLEAAEDFESASRRYKASAEKMPHLKEFYMDYVLYMRAWSEIEKARYYHARQEYGQAKKHYEKAASLHKSSESWKYLALTHFAWAQLEHAEDLSRDEQSQEAIQAFQKATELFREAKRTLRVESDRIENANERDLAKRLIRASDIRREYCVGRIALEEAKILDRQGDHAASSRKYASAAEKFQKAIDDMEHESDRQELRPIVCLCRAWQMMTRAEAEASPEFYLEASQLFDETKEHSFNEKAKILALGHSSFCKALEAGTRFEATRDMMLHSVATQHLESAANYYVRAGFKAASEYAKATQRLFDAYVYMDNAKKEADPEKKARYYMMAEKVLQTSAGSYLKAKHPEKSEEIQRLLEKVGEERELAASLSKVLHAPTIASSTASFVTPTPSEESAVGLERFEHANVQANLIVQLREVKVGEDFALEIELVNAGKGPATLVKVEEIVPKGFKIIEKPEMYRLEDRFLNMKGKQLGPLKTEEVKLVLRPLSKGAFPLKPRILYLDETGKYKSHEPEPIPITVRELGIKGWLKGPG